MVPAADSVSCPNFSDWQDSWGGSIAIDSKLTHPVVLLGFNTY